MNTRLKIASALLLSGALASASADELRILTSELVPYSYVEDGVQKGMIHDAVAEMAKRAGHSGKMEFLPLGRAQNYAQTEKATALFPVARIEAREKQYTWIVPIFQDEFLLFKRDDSTVDISSVATAKNLRVGYNRGSPAERFLKENGFTAIEDASSEEATAKKLMAGRIDAWVTASTVARFTMGRIGEKPQRLKTGFVFARPNLHLAGSLDIAPAEVERWKAALASMQSDGSYARIMGKYLGP